MAEKTNTVAVSTDKLREWSELLEEFAMVLADAGYERIFEELISISCDMDNARWELDE